MKTKLLAWIILFLAASVVESSERDYQTLWCNSFNGKMEVVLSDRTRVDCLTDEYAIEFDFGKKWSEAIGQSLGYAIETNRTPGIVLIIENKKGYKYWIKLNSVVTFYGLPIQLWMIKGDDYEN